MPKKEITVERIPEGKWVKLRQRLEKSGGRLILLVHPFYCEGKGEYFKKYEKVVESVLKKTSWPIVLFEEHTKIAEAAIQKRLRSLGAKGVLVIPTDTGSPYPRQRVFLGAAEYDEEISYIIYRLKKAGAKNIYVGGMFAQKSAPEISHGIAVKAIEAKYRRIKGKSRFKYLDAPIAEGCAGYTYRKLVLSKEFGKVRWIPNAMYDPNLRISDSRPYTEPRLAASRFSDFMRRLRNRKK